MNPSQKQMTTKNTWKICTSFLTSEKDKMKKREQRISLSNSNNLNKLNQTWMMKARMMSKQCRKCKRKKSWKTTSGQSTNFLASSAKKTKTKFWDITRQRYTRIRLWYRCGLQAKTCCRMRKYQSVQGAAVNARWSFKSCLRFSTKSKSCSLLTGRQLSFTLARALTACQTLTRMNTSQKSLDTSNSALTSRMSVSETSKRSKHKKLSSKNSWRNLKNEKTKK